MGDNLKRTDGYVLFRIGYYYSDDWDHKVKYHTDDNLDFVSGKIRDSYFKKMNSIEDLLKYITEFDINSKNNDNDW